MQSILQYHKLRQHAQAELNHTCSSVVDHTIQPDSLDKSSPTENDLEKSEAPAQNLKVTLDGNKEFDPRGWPIHRKILYTAIACSSGTTGGWASANVSAVSPQVMEHFHVSEVTESLATGLYLVGFGIGSLISGPFSEAIGRNPVYLGTIIAFMLMLVGSGLSQNIGTQLVFRLLAGVFGCTAVTTFAGSTADMWSPSGRGLVFNTGSTFSFTLVFLAPLVGGFIGQSDSLNWRWTEWIAILVAGISFVLLALLLPETNMMVLESWKAKHLRQLTGDQRYRSERENESTSLGTRLFQSIHRPFEILFQELTVGLFTAYLAVVYVVTFTFLTGFTFIYTNVYGFSQGSTGLCFIGLSLGILIGGSLGIPLQRKYLRDLANTLQSGGTSLPPEQRLITAIITAPALPIGLFWMAWTSRPSVSYWSSLGGSVLVGMAFIGLFVPIYLYLMDMFEEKAASALAVTTVVRYVAAGGMVTASIPIYEALGVDWTLTILAVVSLLLTPLPFLFYRFGHLVRKRSPNATKAHT